MSSTEEATRASLENTPRLSDAVIRGVCWSLAAVAFLAVLSRCSMRAIRFRKLYIDDWLVLVAFFLAITLGVVFVYNLKVFREMSSWSHGTPLPSNFLDIISTYHKLVFTASILFYSQLWAVKFSFLFFFRRLSGREKQHEFVWWISFGITVIGYCICIIMVPLTCNKFTYQQCSLDPAYVRRGIISLRLSTAMDILSDLLIIAIPIHLLRNIRLPNSKKYYLLLLLCSGIFIVVITIVRIAVTNPLPNNGKADFPNPTWLAFWTSIEGSVSLIVSCLTAFKSLFSKDISGGSFFSQGSGSDSRWSLKRLLPSSLVSTISSRSRSGNESKTGRSNISVNAAYPSMASANTSAGDGLNGRVNTTVTAPSKSIKKNGGTFYETQTVQMTQCGSDEDLFKGHGVYVKREFGSSP